MSDNKQRYTEADLQWAENFDALFNFIERFERGGNAERVTLLLSTCRNFYMTVNAMFTNIQKLLGDSQDGLRPACELLERAIECSTLRDRFEHSMAMIDAFNAKADVWLKRQEIYDLINAELNKMEQESDPKTHARLQNIIYCEPTLTSHSVEGRCMELLALDLTERPHLQPHYEEMQAICHILGTVAELGLSYSEACVEPDPSPRQPALPGVQESAKSKSGKRKVPSDLALELANCCEFSSTQEDPQLAIVRFGQHYRRPRSCALPDPVKIPLSNTSTELCQAAKDYASLMREALYLCHSRACNDSFFRPNVAKPPMPAPFILELPAPLPEFGIGRSARLQVAKRRCATTHTVPDSFRLAMAKLVVPHGPVLKQTRYELEGFAKPHIESDVRAAIRLAATHSCAAITFPEYSIPISMRSELLALAKTDKMVLIGGFEGQWLNGKLVNEVFVAIPGEPRLYSQFKQCPSNEEQTPECFYRDNTLSLFRDSPIGDFSVIVCSDFMELETLQAWKGDGPLPDVLFVIARNTYPDLYKHLAIAQSLQLYCALLICNIHDEANPPSNLGSCLVLPKRQDPIDEVGTTIVADGHYLRGIATFNVPVAAIRARGRGKPSPGFLTVPKSAQRA